MTAIVVAALVLFTHLNGEPVAVNTDNVASVHPSPPGHQPGTMIDTTGGGFEIVRESFEEVVKRLENVPHCSTEKPQP